MSVEKIDAMQPIQTTPIIEKQVEIREKTGTKSSGSSKDVVTALSVLAAIGAAGVAVYKHNNAKKMVEEAEKAAKKKVEEAEEKVKKAAEDVDKKIQDAVEKVKNEYEKKINKTPETPDIIEDVEKEVILEPKKLSKIAKKIKSKFKITLKKAKVTTISEEASPKTEKKTSFFKNLKNIFKRTPKSAEEEVTVKPKAEEPKKEPINPIFEEGFGIFPKKTPKRNPVFLEDGIKDTELEVLDGFMVNRIRNSKNGIKIVPTSTKLADFFQGKIDALKNRNKNNINKLKPVVVEQPEVQPKKERTKAEIEKDIIAIKKEIKNVLNRENTILRTSTDEELIESYYILKEKIANKSVEDIDSKMFLSIKGELFNHRGYRFTGKEQNPIKKSGNAFRQQIEKQLGAQTDYAKQAESFVNQPKSESEHNIIQALYDEMAEAEEKKAVYIFKGIKIPDVKDVSEQNLITEYNALKNIVKNIQITDSAAKRFLEIQGELINHRGFYINEQGELIKRVVKEVPYKPEIDVKQIYDNGAKKGLKEIEKAEFAKRHEKIASHRANKKWLKEQHEIKEQEYQKLFDEHYAEQGRKIVADLEEKLNGKVNFVVETPRKHNKHYHNKLQKEYDKLATE